jgi:hypothetical protein
VSLKDLGPQKKYTKGKREKKKKEKGNEEDEALLRRLSGNV